MGGQGMVGMHSMIISISQKDQRSMLISCSRCGRVHERGKCPKAKPRGEAPRTSAQRFRSTARWTELSRRVRERDSYLCQACLREDPPRYTTARLSVHHIVPLAADFDRRDDPANLITLCDACHELAESGAIPAEVLAGWAREAEERLSRGDSAI